MLTIRRLWWRPWSSRHGNGSSLFHPGVDSKWPEHEEVVKQNERFGFLLLTKQPRPWAPGQSCPHTPARVAPVVCSWEPQRAEGGVGSGGRDFPPADRQPAGGQGAAPCASVHIRPVRGGARAQLHPTQRFETSQLRCLMVLGSVPKQVPGFPRTPAESTVTSSGSAGCPPSSAQPPSLSSRTAAPSLCSASCHVASDPDPPVCHLLGPL